MSNSSNKKLTGQQKQQILQTLQERFQKNKNRHKTIEWNEVKIRLEKNSNNLWSLYQMELTGGEPDLVDFNSKKGEYIFFDCSAESPLGRRSICYDKEGLKSRKEHAPKFNAVDMAAEMGIALLTEKQYRQLQEIGTFDAKTSSWLQTPDSIRKSGGAIFGDYRYGAVFIYHNGAQSYYGSRGFRGCLIV